DRLHPHPSHRVRPMTPVAGTLVDVQISFPVATTFAMHGSSRAAIARLPAWRVVGQTVTSPGHCSRRWRQVLLVASSLALVSACPSFVISNPPSVVPVNHLDTFMA